MDYGLLTAQNYVNPPDAEPFVARPWPAQQSDRNSPRNPSLGHTTRDEEKPHSAEAPSRRSKPGKFLQLDRDIEIKSSEMKSWDENYTSNMAKAAAHRAIVRAPILAKKVAEHWIWTMGIGGIGAILADSNIPTPLDMFYGDKLFATISGDDSELNPRKRDHSSIDGESTETEGRRVRPKSDSLIEVGRGDVDMDASGFQAAIDDEVGLLSLSFHGIKSC